ncbi:hypothetical protein AKO1_003599 [Acrasis kona]|uniref:Uncharacterized protein n=1 Tax=Acrasis kona TaxID=1008807 RepID=A0AAW2Z5X4_9EUKA
MRVVAIALLVLVAYVRCGDNSCVAPNTAQRAERAVLSITPPNQCPKPVQKSSDPFYKDYACYVGVDLQTTFDGQNGPISLQQMEKSRGTFARGLKGCEFCGIDCSGPVVFSTKKNNGLSYGYYYLFTECDNKYYAYSCIAPTVTKSSKGVVEYETNTNCRSSDSLSDREILGVLDVCVKYNGCKYNSRFSKAQVIDAFNGRNDLKILSESGSVYYDPNNNDKKTVYFKRTVYDAKL